MEFDTQVKLAIYHYFAETGRGPSPNEVAERIGSDVELVIESYQRLLVLEADGSSIHMAPPFSGIPTQHIVEADGIQYFANCAWDSLGIPAALHKAATVHSICAQSGMAFELDVSVQGPEPSNWLFHCLVTPRNGGTTLSLPEVTCSSSSRKNRFENGVMQRAYLFVHWSALINYGRFPQPGMEPACRNIRAAQNQMRCAASSPGWAWKATSGTPHPIASDSLNLNGLLILLSSFNVFTFEV